MATEKDGYLPPHQQLVLAAKVNRLCEVLPKNFDPETQVEDASEIVRLLDPRLQTQRGFQLIFSRRGRSDSSILAGATNAGQINYKTESESERQVKFNIKEYKIGGYVATKVCWWKDATIILEDFWNPHADGTDLGVLEPKTIIRYNPKLLDVRRITRVAFTPRRILGFINFPKAHPLDMWKAESST